MALAKNDMSQLIETVWTSILGLPIQDSLIDPEEWSHGSPDKTLTSCIHVTGAWMGVLILDCPEFLAKRIATALYGGPFERMSSLDVRKALGEIINMTGGNIRTLLPGPSHLSLPMVTDGSDYAVTISGTRILTRVVLECDGQPFRLTLLSEGAETSGEWLH